MITPEQNSLFHCFIRDIAKHIRASGDPISEDLVKRIVKTHFGNTRVFTVKIGGMDMPIVDVMSTTKYKAFDTDLTEKDHEKGFISMEELISNTVQWASSDLNLQLVSPSEANNDQ